MTTRPWFVNLKLTLWLSLFNGENLIFLKKIIILEIIWEMILGISLRCFGAVYLIRNY